MIVVVGMALIGCQMFESDESASPAGPGVTAEEMAGWRQTEDQENQITVNGVKYQLNLFTGSQGPIGSPRALNGIQRGLYHCIDL